METDDLKLLVAEIKAGRGEETTLELKRAWWKLDLQEQQHEFLKDICGMANANASRSGGRLLLVGVDPRGRLKDSPLPRDEADLQELLQKITPHPNVTFREHDVEGVVVTVIEVRPPFDRPYVAHYDSKYWVHLRSGTRVGTATRAHLDRFYSDRNPHLREPILEVEVGAVEESPDDDFDTPRGKPNEGAAVREWECSFGRLAIPLAPRHTDYLRGIVEELDWIERKEAREPALCEADMEKLAEYRRALSEHRDSVEDEGAFMTWYWAKYGEEVARWFRLRVVNSGSAEATKVRARVELPPGLVALEDLPPSVLSGQPRPRRPLLEEDLRELKEWEALNGLGGGMGGVASGIAEAMKAFGLLGGMTSLTDPFAAAQLQFESPIVAMPRFSRSAEALVRQFASVEIEENSIDLRTESLLHDHMWEPETTFALMAEPGAESGEHKVIVHVFCRELEAYQRRELQVVVGPEVGEKGLD